MTSRQSPAPRDDAGAPPPGHGSADQASGRARGIRAAVLGGAVMVLAPLFGFLGGSMTGTGGVAEGGFDPLVMWLFGGLVIGGLGGVVAILGLLRWTRSAGARPAGARAPGP